MNILKSYENTSTPQPTSTSFRPGTSFFSVLVVLRSPCAVHGKLRSKNKSTNPFWAQPPPSWCSATASLTSAGSPPAVGYRRCQKSSFFLLKIPSSLCYTWSRSEYRFGHYAYCQHFFFPFLVYSTSFSLSPLRTYSDVLSRVILLHSPLTGPFNEQWIRLSLAFDEFCFPPL